MRFLGQKKMLLFTPFERCHEVIAKYIFFSIFDKMNVLAMIVRNIITSRVIFIVTWPL